MAKQQEKGMFAGGMQLMVHQPLSARWTQAK